MENTNANPLKNTVPRTMEEIEEEQRRTNAIKGMFFGNVTISRKAVPYVDSDGKTHHKNAFSYSNPDWNQKPYNNQQ